MKIDQLSLLVTLRFNGSFDLSLLNNAVFYLKSEQVIFMSSTGRWDGTHLKYSLSPIVKSEFWDDKIKSILLFDIETEGEYVYITLLLSLNINILRDIIKRTDHFRPSEGSEGLLLELYRNIFPDLDSLKSELQRVKGKSSGPEMVFKNYTTLNDVNNTYNFKIIENLLIVVPFFSKNRIFENTYNDLENFLTDFENDNERTISISKLVPYGVNEFIETVSINLFRTQLRIFIVTQCESNDYKILVPTSIDKIRKINIQTQILNTILENFDSFYFEKINLQQYLTAIVTKRNLNVYKKIFNEKRYSSIQKRFHFEDIYNVNLLLQEEYPFSSVQNGDYKLIKNLVSFDPGLSWFYLQYDWHKHKKSLTEFKKSLDKATLRDDILSNYIRDLYTLKAIETDNNLQKTVKLISIFALLLVLVGFIVELYPEVVKHALENLIEFLPKAKCK